MGEILRKAVKFLGRAWACVAGCGMVAEQRCAAGRHGRGHRLWHELHHRPGSGGRGDCSWPSAQVRPNACVRAHERVVGVVSCLVSAHISLDSMLEHHSGRPELWSCCVAEVAVPWTLHQDDRPTAKACLEVEGSVLCLKYGVIARSTDCAARGGMQWGAEVCHPWHAACLKAEGAGLSISVLSQPV